MAAIVVVELEVGVGTVVVAVEWEELLQADASIASDAASIAIERFRITEL